MYWVPFCFVYFLFSKMFLMYFMLFIYILITCKEVMGSTLNGLMLPVKFNTFLILSLHNLCNCCPIIKLVALLLYLISCLKSSLSFLSQLWNRFQVPVPKNFKYRVTVYVIGKLWSVFFSATIWFVVYGCSLGIYSNCSHLRIEVQLLTYMHCVREKWM